MPTLLSVRVRGGSVATLPEGTSVRKAVVGYVPCEVVKVGAQLPGVKPASGRRSTKPPLVAVEQGGQWYVTTITSHGASVHLRAHATRRRAPSVTSASAAGAKCAVCPISTPGTACSTTRVVPRVHPGMPSETGVPAHGVMVVPAGENTPTVAGVLSSMQGRGVAGAVVAGDGVGTVGASVVGTSVAGDGVGAAVVGTIGAGTSVVGVSVAGDVVVAGTSVGTVGASVVGTSVSGDVVVGTFVAGTLVGTAVGTTGSVVGSSVPLHPFRPFPLRLPFSRLRLSLPWLWLSLSFSLVWLSES